MALMMLAELSLREGNSHKGQYQKPYAVVTMATFMVLLMYNGGMVRAFSEPQQEIEKIEFRDY